MAGTLQVNEGAAWTPAGWIFNNVLERIAARLVAEDPQLSETVADSLGPVPGHLDLCEISAARLQLILRAAEEIARRVRAGGAQAFHEAAFFEPFLLEVDQLLQLLRADPRVGSVSEG